MIILNVTIPGDPVPQHRPRFARTKQGYVRTYNVKEDGDYREKLVWSIKHSVEAPVPRDRRLRVRVGIYRPIPKSTSNSRRLMMLHGQVSPTGRPDADNYLKQIMDGLNSVVWEDDSQITDAQVQKFYSETPRLHLIVELY